MIAKRITTLFVKEKIFAFSLLIIVILINYFYNAVKSTKPSWNAVLKVDQNLVVIPRV